MSSLTFQFLQESDIPELKEMFIQYNPGDDRDEGYQFNPAQVKKFLSQPQNVAFVAKLDGKIIGCVYGYTLTMIDEDEKEFMIYGVDIHPEYHNRGYGTELMKYVLNWLKDNGYRDTWVYTGAENKAACRCYEKAGMVYSGDDARSYDMKFK